MMDGDRTNFRLVGYGLFLVPWRVSTKAALRQRNFTSLEDMFYATLQVTYTPITGFLSPHMIDFTNYWLIGKLMLRQSFLMCHIWGECVRISKKTLSLRLCWLATRPVTLLTLPLRYLESSLMISFRWDVSSTWLSYRRALIGRSLHLLLMWLVFPMPVRMTLTFFGKAMSTSKRKLFFQELLWHQRYPKSTW